MRLSSTPETNILHPAIAMMCPPKSVCVCVGRSLDQDIARQHADFAALIDAEGDLAEVHVVQCLVERDRVATDGGDGSLLCLVGIEIRRREDDHVAVPPATGIQDFDRGAAGVGGLRQLGPGVRPVTVQVQGSAHEHDPAVTRSLSTHPPYLRLWTLSVRVMVALRVWGLASVPISSSPCTMIHSVVSSRSLLSEKLSLPLIVKLCSGGGLTSRTTSLSFSMVTASSLRGHLPVRPGGRIGPALRAGRRESFAGL